jgi:hypothetical protein
MKDPHENPFERFDLDPKQGPRAITERLRELAEEAAEAERAEIRAAWEELTLHPVRRLRAAIGAPPRHPDAGRTAPDNAPLMGARKLSAQASYTLGDLAPRPQVAGALARLTQDKLAPRAPLALDDDPVLSPLLREKKR